MLRSTYALVSLLLVGGPLTSGVVNTVSGSHTKCDDSVPLNIRILTEGTRFQPFTGADGIGAICYLGWEGEAAPPLTIYGPTWVAEYGYTFSSPKQAAAQYAGESPDGVEPLPGASGAYMVYDPRTLSRRVFVEYAGKVYMIVSNERVPVAVLADAILGTNED